MKKLLAILLAVLMCVTVLAGCKKQEETGGNGGGGTIDTSDPNRIPPEVLDFEGYEFSNKIYIICNKHSRHF